MDKLSSIFYKTRLFRIIAAIALIVLVFVPLFGRGMQILLLIFSALFCAGDIWLDGMALMKKGEYINPYFLVLFVTLVLFITRFIFEAPIVLLMMHLGMFALDELTDMTRTVAFNRMGGENLDCVNMLYETFDKPGCDKLLTEQTITASVNPVFVISFLCAVAYAIFMPFLKNLTVQASIHRALAMILVSTPFAMTASFRSIGSVALCHCASNGVVFSNAATLEYLEDARIAVLDDNILQEKKNAGIIYANCARMNHDAFLNFIFHLVYESQQPFAIAVKDSVKGSYDPNLISQITDIPGYGIQGFVNGIRVIFGNDALVTKLGVNIAGQNNPLLRGQYYYLCIEKDCIGTVVISDDEAFDSAEIVTAFDENGIKCTLSSQFDTEKTSKKAIIGIYYPENREICAKDINICINNIPDERDDATVLPDCINSITMVPYMSRRVNEVAVRNAFFVFVVKVLIIVMAILGFVNPWLAILLDIAAACFSILNANRVRGAKIIKSRII